MRHGREDYGKEGGQAGTQGGIRRIAGGHRVHGGGVLRVVHVLQLGERADVRRLVLVLVAEQIGRRGAGHARRMRDPVARPRAGARCEESRLDVRGRVRMLVRRAARRGGHGGADWRPARPAAVCGSANLDGRSLGVVLRSLVHRRRGTRVAAGHHAGGCREVRDDVSAGSGDDGAHACASVPVHGSARGSFERCGRRAFG